jgi:hypothetical protein
VQAGDRIDDHSRFVVIATVVTEPSARAVCQAFTTAMARYGVPSEVLTDNGKQFTGRFTKPYPAEVLFERICRENGISTRLTKPRSPTTTGKIERWHKTLRRELLDAAGVFPDIETAQASIDAWVHGYNHSRPHQSLSMATPATVFRPAPIEPVPAIAVSTHQLTTVGLDAVVVASRPTPRLPAPNDTAVAHVVHAVEWEAVLTPRARLILPANQQLKFTAALAGRTVTLWADDRSIHVVMDGTVIRTRPSRLSEHDLRELLDRGARVAGHEPARSAVTVEALTTSTAIEVNRTADRDGYVGLSGTKVLLDPSLHGQRVTLRFEGALMHVLAAGRLVKTLPAPVDSQRRATLRGARPATESLPPPAPPLRAMRRVNDNGRVTVAGQRLRVGRTCAGQTVLIAIEDTVFRVLLNGAELTTHARRTDLPITRFKGYPRRQKP